MLLGDVRAAVRRQPEDLTTAVAGALQHPGTVERRHGVLECSSAICIIVMMACTRVAMSRKIALANT